MKRVIPILLTLVLVISLAVPAFAESDYPSPPVWDTSTYPYAIMRYYNGTYQFRAYRANAFYYDNAGLWCFGAPNGDTSVGGLFASYSDGAWSSFIDANLLNDVVDDDIVWVNFELLNSDGSVFMAPEPLFCDGSICPASDLDHNNVCDDCGKVLTMSLRSTLLSYVQSVADDYSSGYPYYAVFENLLGGLNLYLSKQPITIDGSDYDHVVGTSGQWTHATTDDSGVHSHDVFVSWNSPTGGTLVYANHEIENFRMPPLAVVIQGVTEGELMEVTVPNLARVIKILVPCGVGCLALLIVLSLFGKRSLIFRN